MLYTVNTPSKVFAPGDFLKESFSFYNEVYEVLEVTDKNLTVRSTNRGTVLENEASFLYREVIADEHGEISTLYRDHYGYAYGPGGTMLMPVDVSYDTPVAMEDNHLVY